MPTARTGGWQCLSGPDPLTAASLAWGPWEDGVGWVAGALALSDTKSPSASVVAWKLARRAGAEAGSELAFTPRSIGSSGLGQVVRRSGRQGHKCPKLRSPNQTRGLPQAQAASPCLQGGDQGHAAGGSGPGTSLGISGLGIPSALQS